MKRLPAILMCVWLAAAGGGQAAPQRPARQCHIGYVFPPGGQQGATVNLAIGGENIYGAHKVLMSGPGISAEIVDSRDPQEGMLERKKKPKAGEAAISEEIRLRVKIAPDAAPGPRDICVATKEGISNKLVFEVGQLREIAEVEPNNKRKAAFSLPELPVAVVGQILPGDVDWFAFKARKGQRLVVEAEARRLLPYIADAVPGWFQAIVLLQGPEGKTVAVADSFRFSQDPVLFYDVPADGEYAVSVRDSIYRGREDFVYRVRIGELPFLTGVFPLGGPGGAVLEPVRVRGVNLPCETVSMGPEPADGAGREVFVTCKGLVSNRLPFGGGDLPERVETQPATRVQDARMVELPVVVNACLRTPGERHYYRFQGVKGQTVCLEVDARRFGSPLDSRLTLFDPGGSKLAVNDDAKNAAEGFQTHHADSALTCVLPADGAYTVSLYDIQGGGGEDFAYRLRLGPPEPDFSLCLTPAAVRIPRGGSAAVTAHVIRRGGFAGTVNLALDRPPAGLTMDAARIPAGADKVVLTLSAGAGTPAGVLAVRVTGSAVEGGRTLVRRAVPSEQLMQAFLYTHLFAFREFSVLVDDPPAAFRVAVKLPAEGVLNLPSGKETSVPVEVNRQDGYRGGIRLQMVEAPKGLTFRNAFIPPGKDHAMVVLRAESSLATNLEGNLVFEGSMPVEREATPDERARLAAKAAAQAAEAKTASATNAANVSTSAVAIVKQQAAEGKPVMVTRPLTLVSPAVPFCIVAGPKSGAGNTSTGKPQDDKRNSPVK